MTIQTQITTTYSDKLLGKVWASLQTSSIRTAILITGSYFVAGLFILFGVNVKRGMRASRRQHI